MVGLAIMSQAFQMRQGQKHLTGQHAAEVAVDSENGNGSHHKAESKEHGGNTLQKGSAGAAQAV